MPEDLMASAPALGEAARSPRQALRLGLLRALGPFVRPRGVAARPPHRVLVVRPDHLGDVLFTTPALALLRRALPGARITYLCGPWSAPLLAGNPNVDETLPCDFPWFDRRPATSPAAPYQVLERQARLLRAKGFDAALNLRFDFWWGALLVARAGIPLRVGYDVAECRPFLSQAVPYQRGRHEVLQDLSLCRAALADWGVLAPPEAGDSESRLAVYPSEADRAAATALLGAAGVRAGDGRPLVAIHPGAGAAVKLWPAERWAEVGNALAREKRARVVLTGSAGEADLCLQVAAGLVEAPILLAGQTNLGQLAALFGLCDLVVGADSGPLHLAAAAGAPTVHLFGPADARLFGPWGDPRRHRVVAAHYMDEPCHGRPCQRLDYTPAELPSHPCMASISGESVMEAAEEALEATPAGALGAS